MQAGDAYSSWAPGLTLISGVRFFSYGGAFGEPECRCVCVEQNITLEAKIEQLKNELTINRTQLSSTRRKLVCAEDPRESATRVGLIGISFIGALGIFLVSGDFISVVSYIIGVIRGNA
ncbi:hypothetical protein FSP39_003154 [Pinctada imbricata]|uniref:Uncharacterized protein n=1 Tax=Pinctada imbricata TaxID=66713 RepID=A0AA89C222_PINIB|nr:hypothetical protein FSP39_003154 [Pinctada imbricata]